MSCFSAALVIRFTSRMMISSGASLCVGQRRYAAPAAESTASTINARFAGRVTGLPPHLDARGVDRLHHQLVRVDDLGRTERLADLLQPAIGERLEVGLRVREVLHQRGE